METQYDWALEGYILFHGMIRNHGETKRMLTAVFTSAKTAGAEKNKFFGINHSY